MDTAKVIPTDQTRHGNGQAPIKHRKRRLILEEERKAVRDHRRNNTPTPSYKDLIQWFSQQYDGYVLGKSTVGECLSIKYDYLDTPIRQHVFKCEEDGKEKWPELEEALRRWTQRHLDAKRKPNAPVCSCAY